MSGHTWKLLDWFRENPQQSSTRLAINSNLQLDLEDVLKLLDRAKGATLDLYTSNESITSQAEYIRDGLVWEIWTRNMHMLANSKQLRGLHVMCTINALCLDTLPDFLDYMLEFKAMYGKDFPTFTLNILRFPSFQSPLVLPDDIRTEYKDRLEAWYKNNLNNPLLHQMELNQTQRLIDYLDIVKTPHSDTFDMSSLHNDFKQFYSQYDQRRDKDFVQSFPRLASWYNSL